MVMYPAFYDSNIQKADEVIKIWLIVILFSMNLAACSTSKYSKEPSISTFGIVNATIAKGVREEGDLSLPVKATHEFTSEDKEVVSHILFSNLTGVHRIRWDWYDPDGKLYYSTDDYKISARKGMQIKKGSLYHKLKLKDSNALDHPGTWMVKISLDNRVERLESFSLQKIISIAEIAKIDFGNYHALVIGNDNYRSLPKLKSSTKDAKEIADLLEKNYGFKVNLQLNATRLDVITALNYFRKNLAANDNLLVYYAGHGILDDQAEEGYWLPVDATEESEVNWISNSLITRNIKAINAKHILVVADSCYSGKLLRSTPKRAVKIKSKSKIQSVVKLNADQTPDYGDIYNAGHDSGDFIFVRNNLIKKER